MKYRLNCYAVKLLYSLSELCVAEGYTIPGIDHTDTERTKIGQRDYFEFSRFLIVINSPI